jgi:hypothetical protein
VTDKILQIFNELGIAQKEKCISIANEEIKLKGKYGTKRKDRKKERNLPVNTKLMLGTIINY